MHDDDRSGPRRAGASREDQRRLGYDADEDLHARGVGQDERQFGGDRGWGGYGRAPGLSYGGWSDAGSMQRRWPGDGPRSDGVSGTSAPARRAGPKGWRRSDARIHDDVCERLSRSALDASDVSVEVRDGHVTLSGTVSDRPMKHAIESLVDACSGVRDIDNRIKLMRIDPGAGPGDAPARPHDSVPQDSPTARDEAQGRFSRPLPGAAGKGG